MSGVSLSALAPIPIDPDKLKVAELIDEQKAEFAAMERQRKEVEQMWRELADPNSPASIRLREQQAKITADTVFRDKDGHIMAVVWSGGAITLPNKYGGIAERVASRVDSAYERVQGLAQAFGKDVIIERYTGKANAPRMIDMNGGREPRLEDWPPGYRPSSRAFSAPSLAFVNAWERDDFLGTPGRF